MQHLGDFPTLGSKGFLWCKVLFCLARVLIYSQQNPLQSENVSETTGTNLYVIIHCDLAKQNSICHKRDCVELSGITANILFKRHIYTI
jgi:hypothetical protein